MAKTSSNPKQSEVNPEGYPLEDKPLKMSHAELRKSMGGVIQAYKRFTTMGQDDGFSPSGI